MTIYQLFKYVIAILIIFALIAVIASLIAYTITKKKYFKMIAIIGFIMIPIGYVLNFAVAVTQYSVFDLSSVDTFHVSSDNLHNGIWDVEITNTENGENVSPQLSWDKVDGAEAYVVYMIDPDSDNWIHMISGNVYDTQLDKGAVSNDIDGHISQLGYIGPYPASGTHSYEVYVFAITSAKDGYVGHVDSVCDGIDYIAEMIDVYDNGDVGNVIAYGKLVGTYSN